MKVFACAIVILAAICFAAAAPQPVQEALTGLLSQLGG